MLLGGESLSKTANLLFKCVLAEGVLKLVFLGISSLSSSHCSYIKTTYIHYPYISIKVGKKQASTHKRKMSIMRENELHALHTFFVS